MDANKLYSRQGSGVKVDQSERHYMVALGIENDTPPLPELQDPLHDGIHLRWNYSQSKGFPWYGTHLLRRESKAAGPVCLGDSLNIGQSLFPGDDFSFVHGILSSSIDLNVFPGHQGKPAIAITGGAQINFLHKDERPMLDVVVHAFFQSTGSIQALGLSGSEVVETVLLENKDPLAKKMEYRFRENGINRISLVAQSLAGQALVDVCFTPYLLKPNEDWLLVPGFTYPLSLPVSSASYPCSTSPGSFNAALKMALARSTVDPGRVEAEFREFHQLLQAMVDRGPAHGSTSVVQVDYSVTNSATQGQNTMQFRVHDLLMLAALDVNVAQMLGLYWGDRSANSGVFYDYLLWPDNVGDFHQLPPQDIPFAILNMPWSTVLENGFICYSQTVRKQTPLSVPTGLKAHSLPGTGVSESLEKVVNRFNNIGLYWQAPKPANQGEVAALYHVWRSGPGTLQGAGATGGQLGDPQLLTTNEPIVIGQSDVKGTYPPGWPEQQMYKIDSGLADGRYQYYVSAIDLFGRHSGLSQPVGIKMVDEVLPPPPAGVEAWLLDPGDKWMVKDQAYKNWQSGLTDQEKQQVIGLRVKWRWPEKTHRSAAPDVEEFRVYLHDGLFNTRFGVVTKVKKARSGTTYISTDLTSAEDDDAYQGARLTADNRVYIVISSRQQAGKLELNVENHKDEHLKPTISPETGLEFSLALSAQNTKTHPPCADPSNYNVWGKAIKGNIPCLDGLGNYEIFLTIAANKEDGSLLSTPTIYNPIVYGQVAVTAVRKTTLQSSIATYPRIVRILRDKPKPPAKPYPDGKSYKASIPDYHNRSYYTYRWSNEDHKGLQSHVYRALDETLFQIDWERGENGFAKIDPGIDFPPDWKDKEGLVKQVKTEIEQIHQLPRGDNKKQQQLATDQAMAHYRGLSNNALRALASLRGNEGAFTQITTAPYEDGISKHKDLLEGRTLGRYFYRACFVDKAHNRSHFSSASPPVEMPNTIAPQSPGFNKLVSGDREITLYWNASPEPDVATYRIYHTDNKEDARDFRLMGDPVVEIKSPNRFEVGDETEFSKLNQVYWVVPVNVHGEELGIQAPDSISVIPKTDNKWVYRILFSVNRNAAFSEYLVYRANLTDAFEDTEKSELVGSIDLDELSWTKVDVPPKTINYFQIAAVDKDSNQSDAALASGVSIALFPPDPPEWKSARWVKDENLDNVISLKWEAMETGGQCMLQRRSEFEPNWVSISGWISSEDAEFMFEDETVDEERFYEYRLIFMDSGGLKSTWFENKSIAPLIT